MHSCASYHKSHSIILIAIIVLLYMFSYDSLYYRTPAHIWQTSKGLSVSFSSSVGIVKTI